MISSIEQAAVPGYVAGTWTVDRNRSTVGFALRQIAQRVHGRFDDYDVAITTGDRLHETSVAATIELASLNTGKDKRDHHVRSADILDVEANPTAAFHSTGVTQDGDSLAIHGRLAILGTYTPVTLGVHRLRFSKDEEGRDRVSLATSTRVRRRSINATIPMAGRGILIGETITISIEIEAVRES